MERKKRMKKRIVLGISLWLVGAVCIGTGGAGSIFLPGGNDETSVVKAGKVTSEDIQKQIDEASRKRKSAQQEKEQLEKDITALEDKKGNILEYIETLDNKLAELSDSITENEEEITACQGQIKKLRKEKKKAVAAQKKQYDTMTSRIKYMYENGNDGYIELLLGSGSLSELFNRVEYVNKVTSYDNQMLKQYQKICDKIQKAKESLDAKLEELKNLKESLKVEKSSLNVLMDKKTEQLNNYQSVIDKKNSAVDTQESLIKKQEDELEELLETQRKQIAKERAEAAKKQKDNSAQAGTPTGVPEKSPSSGYQWPLAVAGQISSYFGYRTAPTAGASTYHKGIDVSVPVGTRVLASQSGTVVTASYSASAGNYVAIYHEDGIYTYYMHCSQLCVSVGTKVSKGQQIALSGNTGISTGPHLHFAVYANGAYVNPLNYVSQG